MQTVDTAHSKLSATQWIWGTWGNNHDKRLLLINLTLSDNARLDIFSSLVKLEHPENAKLAQINTNESFLDIGCSHNHLHRNCQVHLDIALQNDLDRVCS